MTLRDKLPELAVEAVMVVFAVTAALAADAWWENRQMEEFAERASAAVLAEVEANLGEFRSTGSALDSVQVVLAQVLQTQDLTAMGNDLGFDLPEVSTAAWRAAQTSQAAAYIDYGWMIQVGRAYEVVDTYDGIGTGLIDAMSDIIGASVGTSLDLDRLRSVFGRLVVLSDVHDQVESRLEAIVAEGAPTRR